MHSGDGGAQHVRAKGKAEAFITNCLKYKLDDQSQLPPAHPPSQKLPPANLIHQAKSRDGWEYNNGER